MKLITSAILLAAASMPSQVSAATTFKPVGAINLPQGQQVKTMSIDPEARRLYVASNGTVMAFDADDSSPVGTLAVAGRVGDVVTIAELGKGFVAATDAEQVVLFDLATLKQTGRIKLPAKPRSLSYDRKTGRLFAATDNGSLVAIDPRTGKIAGTLSLGGDLRASAADGRGHLFIADKTAKALHVVDTTQLKSLGQMPTWPGGGPTALVNDEKERRIYVTTDNGRMVIMDPDMGQMIGYVPIGQGEGGMAVNFMPGRFARMFVPTADGKLTVLQNVKLTASVESIPQVTVKGTAVASDSNTHRVYVAGDGQVIVLGQ